MVPYERSSATFVKFCIDTTVRYPVKVYNSKRNLKNDADRIFITENLTKTKTNLVKSLADLKYNQNIKTYWITNGRVYAKLNESSRRTLIRNHDDIRNLLNASDYDIN
jgi:hypothetical protein